MKKTVPKIPVRKKTILSSRKEKAAGWFLLAILVVAAVYIIYTSFIMKTS